jgi:hypothetical protein
MLVARGRHSSSDAQSLEAWLFESFGLEDQPLSAGALTLLAHGSQPGAGLLARADPVHFQLLRDRIVLVPSAAFSVTGEEAAALCESLNRHFAGRLRIEPVEPDRWCATLAEEIELPVESPFDMAGRAVQPGRAGDALLNEVQMVLHEHPVNEAREARGEPAVNSVWLWGGGRAPDKAQGPWHSVSAGDPVARGLARLAAIRARDLPASADAWLDRSPEDGRHLVVLDALRAPLALSDATGFARRLEDLERTWFAPLLSALRAGRIGMVSVHVPEAGSSFEAIRGDLRRFWRRPKPLQRRTMGP